MLNGKNKMCFIARISQIHWNGMCASDSNYSVWGSNTTVKDSIFSLILLCYF